MMYEYEITKHIDFEQYLALMIAFEMKFTADQQKYDGLPEALKQLFTPMAA